MDNLFGSKTITETSDVIGDFFLKTNLIVKQQKKISF